MVFKIRRKVQKTGGVSLSLTLPKKWTEQANINAGDEIEISINKHGELVLSPLSYKKNQDFEKISKKIITLNDKSISLLEKLIVGSYLKGYRFIEIKSKHGISQEPMKKIEQITNRFIGLEVVDKRRNEVLLQDITLPGNIPFISFLKRMNSIVKEMLSKTFEGILNSNIQELENVIDNEEMVDRLYYLLSRNIRTSVLDFNLKNNTNSDLLSIIDYERIIKRLEGTADHCHRVCNTGISVLRNSEKGSFPKSEWLKEAYLKIQNNFEKIMKAFFMKDVKLATTLIDESLSFREELRNQIIEFHLNPSSLFLLDILGLMERINSYIADIGEAIINIYS